MNQEGIVVACDKSQEWLLPWWWGHYSAHNSFPVLFVDCGLSVEAKTWCSERGSCVPLAGFERYVEKPVAAEQMEFWESQISEISSFRLERFKRPFVLNQSPFPLSLWMDLDCQVRGPLNPLFYLLHFGVDFLARKVEVPELAYSTGVIAFRNDSPLLEQWVREVIDHNDRYIHEEAALTQLLSSQPSVELPFIYNWNLLHGNHPQAVILRFQGGFLRNELRKSLAKEGLL